MDKDDCRRAMVESCKWVRSHDACDFRCKDGRGRCSIALIHASGMTGLDRDELLKLWFESEGK